MNIIQYYSKVTDIYYYIYYGTTKRQMNEAVMRNTQRCVYYGYFVPNSSEEKICTEVIQIRTLETP